MIKTISNPTVMVDGLRSLGCEVTAQDVAAINEVVRLLDINTEVELDNVEGKISISFEIDVKVNEDHLKNFVVIEETLGFNVTFSPTAVANVALTNITKKEIMSNNNNKTTPAPSMEELFSQAISRSNAATAEAAAVTKAFTDAIEMSKQMTAQAIRDNAANNAAIAEALKKMAEESKAAAEKLEAATKAATAQAEESAKRCASMADAVNAQRQAAAQADEGPAWYATTPAKVAGVVAIVAGVAAAGFYGWKAYVAE